MEPDSGVDTVAVSQAHPALRSNRFSRRFRHRNRGPTTLRLRC